MSIPADHVLRPGQYRDKRDGTQFFACNCARQPPQKTLRYIGEHRQHFELVPPPAPKAT